MSRYVALATTMAARSRCKFRHGAVVVKDGRVLSMGHNRMRHTATESNWRTASFHAEEVALRNLRPGAANGATLVVVRLNRSDELAASAPCVRCQSVIDRAGVVRVVHS